MTAEVSQDGQARLVPTGGTTDALHRPARMGTTTRRKPRRPRRTMRVIVPTVERATRTSTSNARAGRRPLRAEACRLAPSSPNPCESPEVLGVNG